MCNTFIGNIYLVTIEGYSSFLKLYFHTNKSFYSGELPKFIIYLPYRTSCFLIRYLLYCSSKSSLGPLEMLYLMLYL